MSLPELPDTPYSLFYEQPGDFEDEGYQYVMDEPGYTADQMRAYALQAVAALRREPMTEKEMEEGRERIFSVKNPYCPCDRKTFSKVARYVEAHHHTTQKEHGK